MATFWQLVRTWRPFLVVILTPLLLLPLPLIIDRSEGKAGYCVLLMAVYWVTEAVPIGVTSLLPVFLFPVLGILTAKQVAVKYMSDLLMLFLGGILMAVAIERWNLHRRIALRILLLVGSEPRWLMLGMMLATWFLSMWISNTATTAMMIPIAEAILQQLKEPMTSGSPSKENDSDNNIDVKVNGEMSNKDDSDKHNSTIQAQDEPVSLARIAKEQRFRLISKGMSLCICYAANSGGIATLTGTGPNMVLKEAADDLYASHGLSNPVNFATWMGLGFPLSALVMILCWIWLQIAFLRCSGLTKCCSMDEERKTERDRVRTVVQAEYNKLGPVSFAETSVLVWFILLVILWVSRDIGGVGGWGDLFPDGFASDATPAVFIGFCLFFCPSELPFRRKARAPTDYVPGEIVVEIERDDGYRHKPLLEWPFVHEKVPWSMFFLLGGGFALSDGCKVSGLSEWMGQQLEVLSGVNTWGILFILCLLIAAMTEVTSNTAISILMMPILSTLALRTNIHPLYYMFPGALACSFAFMLPVATPPNALVFSYGRVKVIDMMLTGVVMNILAIPVLVLAVGTWGNALFELGDIPAAFLNATQSAQSSLE